MARQSYSQGRGFKHPQSPFWYSAFSIRGEQFRKSTGVPYDRIQGDDGKWRPKPGSNLNERKALEVLREHMEQERKGSGLGRLTLDRLLKGVENDYKTNDLKSARVLKYRSRHLRDFFGANCRAGAITQERLRDYAPHPKEKGASHASVNREFSLLRRGFRLGSNVVGSIPIFPMLKDPAARKGFFELEDHTKVASPVREP